MKKLTLTALILISTATLAACSSNTDTASPQSSDQAQTTESTQTTTTVDNSQYDAVVAELKSTIDPEDSGDVTVEIENDVIDSDYPDGHDVIRVVIDGQSKETVKEALDADYSNTATTEQANTLTILRMTVSDIAKKLPNDTAVIDLGYEISADQYDLVAKSTKTQDYIPVGELIVE